MNSEPPARDPPEPDDLDDEDVEELADDDLSPEEIAELERAQEVLIQPSLPPPKRRTAPPQETEEEPEEEPDTIPPPAQKHSTDRFIRSLEERISLETVSAAVSANPEVVDELFDNLRMPSEPPAMPEPPKVPTTLPA